MSAEPMSPERLAAAREVVASGMPMANERAADLLAEVDRLRSVEAAAIEWYEAGADVVPLDGRAHRSIRNLRSAVRAALSGEHPGADA